MEARELRIDNWIKYNFKMQGCKDIQVCANDFYNGFRDDKFVSINYKPIPITEEWLLKFGFKYFADGQYEKIFENLNFNWDKECGLYIFLRTREDCIEASHIKHVHQLQNLYFALTNKELTIK